MRMNGQKKARDEVCDSSAPGLLWPDGTSDLACGDVLPNEIVSLCN
jgi:hypothetical protein